MELLKKIIAKIKPQNGHLKQEIEATIKTLNAELKKNKIKASAVIGGSFAKDTHLIGDHDCDIFVQFDYNQQDKNLSDLLEKAVKKFKATRVHGSRDYFLFTNSLNYEVVPVLKVTNPVKALNVTDVSPLHVAWVRKHKKSDEIRLAKAFCKAFNIYGAESYIKGFSGHVLDILVIYYGSFMNLLKASQKWKEKTVIDIQKYHKDALFELNSSKTQSPLIIVDPIQRDRNAAAALGDEAFNTFIKKAKEFLKNPSEKFFTKKTIKKQDVKGAIILDIIPEEGKKDVVGAKILKAYEAIKRILEDNEFKVQKSGWVWDKEAFVWFILKNNRLTSETVIAGPPMKMENHVAMFKKKHKNTFVKNNRVFAKIKRDHIDAKELIKEFIKTEEVKDRVKSIKIAAESK